MNFPAPDWEEFLRSKQREGFPEIELANLQSGDRLIVLTANTAYEFRLKSANEAELFTNRRDRPAGLVKLNGCTFGASSTIKPGWVFCGGNLEFLVLNDRSIFTTTEIRALQLVESIPTDLPPA